MENHPAVLTPLIALAVIFIAYCLYDILRSKATRHLPKAFWIAVSILTVPTGGICWLIFGRPTETG
jgi:hypothetical protein